MKIHQRWQNRGARLSDLSHKFRYLYARAPFFGLSIGCLSLIFGVIGTIGAIGALQARAQAGAQAKPQAKSHTNDEKPAPAAAVSSVQIGLKLGGDLQQLGHLNLDELKTLESHSSYERDPANGKTARWTGVLLKPMIEQAIEKLPAEKKALVDLVILKGTDGQEALIPRSFIVKYPMILAHSRDGSPISDRGPILSVAPWSSEEKKIQKEGLPVETYFVPGVKEVILANYRDRYQKIFLKRRTNPAAVRGERLFSQSCTSCHGAGRGPSVQDILKQGPSLGGRGVAQNPSHPATHGLPDFKARDWRAFSDYIEAYQFENATN